MSKTFLAIVVVILGVIGGIIFFSGDKADAPTDGTPTAQTSEHKYGDGQKGVTLIEYGDFECPACEAYHPIIKQVKEDMKADIIFQFRHFPLVQSHPNAFVAHRAAEAAGKQGKFWEMHDLIYESHTSWIAQYGFTQNNAISTFEGYAGQLGLNIEQYKADYSSSAVNDTINADIAAGSQIGATSTPTFVLDGKKVEVNPRDVDSFKKLIQDAIDAKNPTQPQPAQ